MNCRHFLMVMITYHQRVGRNGLIRLPGSLHSGSIRRIELLDRRNSGELDDLACEYRLERHRLTVSARPINIPTEPLDDDTFYNPSVRSFLLFVNEIRYAWLPYILPRLNDHARMLRGSAATAVTWTYLPIGHRDWRTRIATPLTGLPSSTPDLENALGMLARGPPDFEGNGELRIFCDELRS